MIFLDCIVGQVNVFVVKIFHVELLGSCSNIAILEPISFLVAIETGDDNVGSDVELSLLIQKRHDILLYDMCPWAPHFIRLLLLDDLFYLFQAFYDLNSSPPICVLSGFDQPGVSFFRFKSVFDLLIFL